MTRQFAFAALLVACTALAAKAQFPEVQPGVRIRVVAPGAVAGRFKGTVLQRTADSLVVGAPNTMPLHIPIARITELEISRGKSRGKGALRGILWGAPIGAGAGLVSMSAINSCDVRYPGTLNRPCTDATSGDKARWVLLSTVSFSLWGAGIGALIGREDWASYDIPQRTSLLVKPRQVGLSVSF